MHIIDKNPVLFEGSIRQNIDPYDQYSDSVIIELLKELKIERVLRRVIFRNQLLLDKANATETLKNRKDNIKIAIEEMRFNVPQRESLSSKPASQNFNKVVPKPLGAIQVVQSDGNLIKSASRNHNFKVINNHKKNFATVDVKGIPRRIDSAMLANGEFSSNRLVETGRLESQRSTTRQLFQPKESEIKEDNGQDKLQPEGAQTAVQDRQIILKKMFNNERGATVDISDMV